MSRPDPDEDLLKPGQVNRCIAARMIESLDAEYRKKVEAALAQPAKLLPRKRIAEYVKRKSELQADIDTIRSHWRGGCGCPK
jgi:hypothetical protein